MCAGAAADDLVLLDACNSVVCIASDTTALHVNTSRYVHVRKMYQYAIEGMKDDSGSWRLGTKTESVSVSHKHCRCSLVTISVLG